jgi:hypothetical protein
VRALTASRAGLRFFSRPVELAPENCLFLPQQRDAVAAFLFSARESRAFCSFPVQIFSGKAARCKHFSRYCSQ